MSKNQNARPSKALKPFSSFSAERFSRAPNEILDTILVEFTRYDPDFNASVFATTLTRMSGRTTKRG